TYPSLDAAIDEESDLKAASILSGDAGAPSAEPAPASEAAPPADATEPPPAEAAEPPPADATELLQDVEEPPPAADESRPIAPTATEGGSSV
ncbi:MAG: hypothetical protein ACYSUR_00005, partial [Planctomycetota bacterium]